MTIRDVGMIIEFIGGLGMFLYGMNIMAEGLQKSAGGKMKQLLGYLTNNRLLAVLVGALVTAIIQSSSATTVMVVGFVNAGLMSLVQAVGVIMGANIGTTVTSWLVSMNEWGSALKPEFFAPLLLGIGVIPMVFSKSERKKNIGEIAVGFGLLFIGLSFMSGAIGPYKDAPVFGQIFATLGKNPILGILAGAVVTAIIQSSSASVSILQTLAMNGVVNWNSAIFITLGQNIGTCVTALISSAGAHKTAKRAAVIHLLFNTIGAGLFAIVMFVIFQFNKELAASSINSVQISVFHTIFNVVCTVVMFPAANLLVKLSGVFIKDEHVQESEEEAAHHPHLDERILETPSFAIESVTEQVVNMGRLVQENVKNALNSMLSGNKEDTQAVYQNEKWINEYEHQLMDYLVKIDSSSLNDKQHATVKNLLYTISDLERIGDHAENIAELADVMNEKGIAFSQSGVWDFNEIKKAVEDAVEYAVRARESRKFEDIRKVVQLEDAVDTMEEEMRDRHITRLADGQCNTTAGVLFLDAISNLERISDHALNIAGYIKEEL